MPHWQSCKKSKNWEIPCSHFSRVANMFRERVLAGQVRCIMVTSAVDWTSLSWCRLNEMLIPCAPGRLAWFVIHQRFCLARELARYPTAATYSWCQLSWSLDCYSESNYIDGEHLFVLQEPSWLRVSARPRDHWIFVPWETVRQFAREKRVCSQGPWVQPQKLIRVFLSFLLWKWLLGETRDSSSLHDQEKWKFGNSLRQVQTTFFSYRHILLSALSWWFVRLFGTFLVQL